MDNNGNNKLALAMLATYFTAKDPSGGANIRKVLGNLVTEKNSAQKPKRIETQKLAR